MTKALEQAIASLPSRFPGPGGACAVLQDGEPLVRHAWGWANAERRIPFSPRTLFRICSITKQFTTMAMLDRFPDPSGLDGAVRARMPLLPGEAPGALHLAHNQSGLRDYWALAMLHGSPAEAPFGDAEAARVIGGTRSLQFRPGTRFSYSNGNFRILSDVLEERTGLGFGTLLRRAVLDRAGMEGAVVAADTRAMPDGTEGYEGTPSSGFRPAVNRVIWTGDAGLAASLDDMIAYERWIDRTRDDPAAPYARISAPVRFADGAEAVYGFGLGRRRVFGRAATGHGGGLRGWRSVRMRLTAERISVVVLFNHMAEPGPAALSLLAALLGEPPPPPSPPDLVEGAYLDGESGLLARVARVDAGTRLHFGQGPEMLGAPGGTLLRPQGEALEMVRPDDNLRTVLTPLRGEARKDIAGLYRCEELDATLTICEAGGAASGAFSGFLGMGRFEALTWHGPDVWTLPCPRALDFAPPGDWTLHVQRDDGGRVTGMRVGCWLARGLRYEKLGAG